MLSLQTSTAPHKSESDLKGWRVVLKVDDDGEEEWGDEVGQGDNNRREVLIDEIHDEIHLQPRINCHTAPLLPTDDFI